MRPAALIFVSCAWLAAGETRLVPRRGESAIVVSAPGLRFLEGSALDRLKNGVSVSFDFQLSLLDEGDRAPLRRAFERFTFSYDLWEERFSVVRRGVLRQASRLSAAAAEAWCLDNLAVPVAGLAAERRILVRLELRVTGSREDKPALSLAALIDLFSRPARGHDLRWTLETPPLRLAELNHAGGK